MLPHRLPAWARRQLPDEFLARVEAQPSGVRLAFRTRATAVELDVLPTKRAYRGAPPQPDGVYDLVVDGRLTGRSSTTRPGQPGTVGFADLSAEVKDVEIWLPQTEITELIALRTDAPVEAVQDHGGRVWLHHGSSISHGSTAAGPTETWPALAAAQSATGGGHAHSGRPRRPE